MGIFSFGKKEPAPAPTPSKSFYAEFSLDIRNLYKQFFSEQPSHAASNGDVIKVFRFNNPINEFGIFDQLEFYEFNTGTRNVFFRDTIGLTKDKVFSLGFLIDNTLLPHLGKDDNGYGKFNAVQELGHMEIQAWSGRTWFDKIPSVMLSQDNFITELAIFSPR